MVVFAVWLDVECSRSVVVEMTWMLRVSGVVVEMPTLVVGGARHATRDDGRCVGHSRRQRSFVRRLVQGAHRRAVRVSSLQLPCLLVADDHPRRREQTRRYDQRVAQPRQHRSLYVHWLSEHSSSLLGTNMSLFRRGPDRTRNKELLLASNCQKLQLKCAKNTR